MATYSTDVNNRVTQAMFERLHSAEAVADGDYVKSWTVYSGVQPTAATVASEWVNYKSSNSNCLAHYSSGITFTYNAGTLTYYFTNVGNSITATALNSGTAAWAILWVSGAVTDLQLSLSALPQSRFVVVPVTDTSGIGIIRYTSLAATQGASFAPYDGGWSQINV